MFEDLIVSLDEMGVQYTEDYEAGTLTVDVGSMDKVMLINVIQLANDSGMEFSIDENSLTIVSGAPMDEPVLDEPEQYPGEDAQAAAFDQYMNE